MSEKILKKSFGKLSDDNDIEIYTLKNSQSEVQITNYGARVVSWKIADKNSKIVDVVLGYANAKAYEIDDKYMGAIAGRCANRIGGAKFELNGKIYNLDKNDGGKNHLHGGFNGFEKKIWQAEIIDDKLKLTCKSADGEGGYPGNLTATVTYSLSDDNELKIDYDIPNLKLIRMDANEIEDVFYKEVNTLYLNFSDPWPKNRHEIQIFADNYTWANDESVPDGRILSVENTPMDLRKLTRIGEHIDDDFDELNFGHGYDHNWCINNFDGSLKNAAHVESDESGLCLNVQTTMPGIQFYAGNFLDGKPLGKNSVKMDRRNGFALETQFYPNAVNLKNFPQPILRKNEIWKAQTIYTLKKIS